MIRVKIIVLAFTTTMNKIKEFTDVTVIDSLFADSRAADGVINVNVEAKTKAAKNITAGIMLWSFLDYSLTYFW